MSHGTALRKARLSKRECSRHQVCTNRSREPSTNMRRIQVTISSIQEERSLSPPRPKSSSQSSSKSPKPLPNQSFGRAAITLRSLRHSRKVDGAYQDVLPPAALTQSRRKGRNRQCAFRAKIDLETCIGLLSPTEAWYSQHGKRTEWRTREPVFYSQRNTLDESTAKKTNKSVNAATSPRWVAHPSPFQIPSSRFTA
jgi:hypothetical protein